MRIETLTEPSKMITQLRVKKTWLLLSKCLKTTSSVPLRRDFFLELCKLLQKTRRGMTRRVQSK